MADSSIIQPTTFPRLDDLLSPIQHEDIDETQYKQREFSFAINHVPCPRGRDALLKSYSQFVASYTSESEVTFQYALRTQLHHTVQGQIIQARCIDEQDLAYYEGPDRCIFEIVQHKEEDPKRFDFGLELIADVDNFASVEAPPQLKCVSVLYP
jgi:hypothetical protein